MEKDPIRRLAESYLYHDMIEKYTELPEFPSQRTRLLFMFLEAGGKTVKSESSLFALVTSLMQMGLDTHDLVKNGASSELHEMRGQQFKVLAGAYFSGRFYYLLAKAGQIGVIKQLSSSVSYVNRLKINLYRNCQQLKSSSEDYFQHMVEICSHLYVSFEKWMLDKHQLLWPNLVKNLVSCELIEQELCKVERGEIARESWSFWFLFENGSEETMLRLESDQNRESIPIDHITKQQIKEQLRKMLNSKLKEAKELMHMINPKSLNEEVSSLWDFCSGSSWIGPSAEEVLR